MARRAVLALVAAVALAGCGAGDDDASRSLTVAAAASLADAFTEVGAAFERAHPGTEVTFTFDSSGALAEQVRSGAPADVFASADEATMAGLVGDGLVAGAPTPFARNRLVVVTRPGNTEGIAGLADLAEVGVVALCSPEAPCGRLADEALARAGVALAQDRVTRGQNATATLTAVRDGDAVAGIVYATDARAAGSEVATVAIPPEADVVTAYPIAVLAGAGDPGLARAFAAFVTSDEARRILEEHGFLPAR